MGPEKRFRTKVERRFKAYSETTNGAFCWWSDNDSYSAGRADTTLVFKGIHIACEFKAADGKATPLQCAHLEKVRRAGGCAGVLREDERGVLGVWEAWRGAAERFAPPIPIDRVEDLLRVVGLF